MAPRIGMLSYTSVYHYGKTLVYLKGGQKWIIVKKPHYLMPIKAAEVK